VRGREREFGARLPVCKDRKRGSVLYPQGMERRMMTKFGSEDKKKERSDRLDVDEVMPVV